MAKFSFASFDFYVIPSVFRGADNACYTSPSLLKSLIAFFCGGSWNKVRKVYQFCNQDAMLHFAFLIGDLDRLYCLKRLEKYRFENQLENARVEMLDIPF
jgi:hypothetical protein